MNSKFRKCLNECKLLNTNSPGLTQNASATADKILYNHAIAMVSQWLNRVTFFLSFYSLYYEYFLVEYSNFYEVFLSIF